MPNVPDFPAGLLRHAVPGRGGRAGARAAGGPGDRLRADRLAGQAADRGRTAAGAGRARPPSRRGCPLLAVLGGEGSTGWTPLAEQAEPIHTYVERRTGGRSRHPLHLRHHRRAQGRGAHPAEHDHERDDQRHLGDLCLTPDDVILGCLPLFHSFGQTCAMNAGFFAGRRWCCCPGSTAQPRWS